MDTLHIHLFVPEKGYCQSTGTAECERIKSAIPGATNNADVLLIQTEYNEENPNHGALALPKLPYLVMYDPQRGMAMESFDPATHDIGDIRRKIDYYASAVAYDEETGTYHDGIGEVNPLAQVSLGKLKGLNGLGLSPFRLFNWPDCEKYLPKGVCKPEIISFLLIIIIGLLLFKILK